MSQLARRNFVAFLSLLAVFTLGVAATAARAEQRIALVVGNAAYAAGAIKTAANDAGLVAQTLESAGFEVMGARDLDQDAVRRAFRDFLDRAASLGSDDVALVYLGGYGLQLEGDNYFVPLDARMERASDIQPDFRSLGVQAQQRQFGILFSALEPGGNEAIPQPVDIPAIVI
jgi:hypothetical protein